MRKRYFSMDERQVTTILHFTVSLLLASAIGGLLSNDVEAQPRSLPLPTDNEALILDAGPEFYMYTDRTFEGRRSRPWQGGMYGFHRNPQRTASGLVYTRFHAGVDIAPTTRDGRGDPLDSVRSIDDGVVSYVNSVEGRSTYGKYVVVEHDWGGSPIYSLYAHLNRTDVRAGEKIHKGDELGLMGYTGRGINQRRAHLHFEINLLVSSDFQSWFNEHLGSATNHHGLFNGINMRGIDVADFYRQKRANPTLTIGRFITQKSPYFKVTVDKDGSVDMLDRYPWMQRAGERPEHNAWEITFTRGGVPISFTPVEHHGRRPDVEVFEHMTASCSAMTAGLLTGPANQCRLSNRGSRAIQLVGTPAPPGQSYGESGVGR